MEYILFIHNNTDYQTTEEQWCSYFAAAKESGIFKGGSEIRKGIQLVAKDVNLATDSVVGYMRFETDDISKLHRLLELHPVYMQGGTLELCETPKS